MKNKIVFALSLCLLVCSTSFGGFVSFDCYFPDDPGQTSHDWAFTGYAPDGTTIIATATNGDTTPADLTTAASYELVLGENLQVTGPDQVTMSGSTDEDPVFHVQKTVTNLTTEVWTSYELMLSSLGDATFIIGGSNSSDVYQNVTESAYLLTFLSPDSVGIGETVVLDFDINVPVIGPFTINLTQNPVPEPTTMLLLGLGGLLLRRRGNA